MGRRIAVESESFELQAGKQLLQQEVVKPGRVFISSILDQIAVQTGQIEKVSDTIYKMSRELKEKLLTLRESFQNLILLVGTNCKGLGNLQQLGKIEQKCYSCSKALSSEKYDYTSGRDKQYISQY